MVLESISDSKSCIPEHSLMACPEITTPKCSSIRAIALITARESHSNSLKVVDGVKAELSSSRTSASAVRKACFFQRTLNKDQTLR